ncbi:MAG TPA: hypothetical protein VMF66_18885 [Candidatus Acidoferrum sp.]|nr:hypothetical protein [Candidatus Acidoferrum sp.]
MRVFFDAARIAEFKERGTAGFVGRHAAIDVVLCFALDVIANVGVQILEHPFAAAHAQLPPTCRLVRIP